jgi:small subunit ribosomal protein S24e
MLEVAHPDQANVSKKALRESIAKKMKTDEKNVVVYGMKTHFGGGRSTGFALIYEN